MMSVLSFILFIWDEIVLVLMGAWITLFEINIFTNLYNWWYKYPSAEEIMVLEVLSSFKMSPKQKRSCLITGANSGIGLETARALAGVGYHVLLACRSKKRGEDACNDIRKSNEKKGLSHDVEFLQLDLSSFEDIHACVEILKERDLILDLLILNAGVLGIPYGLTTDGFETHFGVNYLGHYLLTMLLLPYMKQPGRILGLVSSTYVQGKFSPDHSWKDRRYQKWYAYCTTKLAMLHFLRRLDKKLKISEKNITVYAVNPGSVHTNIANSMNPLFAKAYKIVGNIYLKNSFQGACCSIYCALCPDVKENSGKMFFHCLEEKPVGLMESDEKRFWDVAESLSSTAFPFPK